jgi:hypothetical protein
MIYWIKNGLGSVADVSMPEGGVTSIPRTQLRPVILNATQKWRVSLPLGLVPSGYRKVYVARMTVQHMYSRIGSSQRSGQLCVYTFDCLFSSACRRALIALVSS